MTGSGIRMDSRAFERDVKRLQRGMRGPVVAQAAGVGAERVRDDAKRLVPVLTGRLRDSIVVEETSRGATKSVQEVGPTEPYGGAIELGTAHTAAQPYLRPAVDMNRTTIARTIGNFLERKMRQLVG